MVQCCAIEAICLNVEPCVFICAGYMYNEHTRYIYYNLQISHIQCFFAAERLHDAEYRVAGLCACSAINPPTHTHTIYGHSANTHMRP